MLGLKQSRFNKIGSNIVFADSIGIDVIAKKEPINFRVTVRRHSLYYLYYFHKTKLIIII